MLGTFERGRWDWHGFVYLSLCLVCFVAVLASVSARLSTPSDEPQGSCVDLVGSDKECCAESRAVQGWTLEWAKRWLRSLLCLCFGRRRTENIYIHMYGYNEEARQNRFPAMYGVI